MIRFFDKIEPTCNEHKSSNQLFSKQPERKYDIYKELKNYSKTKQLSVDNLNDLVSDFNCPYKRPIMT